MDKVEVENQIINILEQGPLNFTTLYEKVCDEIKVSKNTVISRLKKLTRGNFVGDSVLLRDPSNWDKHKNVWYCLSKDKEKMEKLKYGYRTTPLNEKKGEREFSEDAKNKSRILHTQDIKDNVIKPWLEQLWSINGLLISCPKGGFFVEDATLFSDFKNHIKFNPNPFNELESYRKKYEEFSDKKSRIYQSEITRIIGEEMEKVPVDFGKKDTTTYDLATWIFGKICDSFDLRLYYSKDFDEREAIGHMNLDFDSYVKDADGSYEYLLIFYIRDSRLQICCGSIAKWKKSKEEFKREMDEFIKIILKRVKESEHIKDTIIALHETRKELFYHLQNMRESLKKHYELQILPGDCRYYPWVE